MNPSPFQVAREAATNISSGIRGAQESNLIENILSQAMTSDNPEILQNSIGQILSQVSPERQGPAIAYLQNTMQQIERKQKERKAETVGREAAKEGGYTYGAPAAVQAQQVKPPSQKAPIGGISGQPVPSGVSSAISQVLQNNPNAKSDELALAFDNANVPRAYSNSYIENRRRQDQTPFEPESEKLEAKRVSELASEIENNFKSAEAEDIRLDRQIKLDEEGNVSTPMVIKALNFFGLPIGVLSNPATEEYSKLEADYVRDVSKVFPGAIRVYEIQAYMKTIPSLLNSAEGRKTIINNRKLINQAKKVYYDEYKKIVKENNGKKPPNLGILLEERTRDRIDEIAEKFRNGINNEIEKFQQPIKMIAPDGKPVNIPPDKIEAALKSGAKFK